MRSLALLLSCLLALALAVTMATGDLNFFGSDEQVGSMVTNCGTPDDDWQFSELVINPDPIQFNKNVTVTVKGTLNKQILSGHVHVVVYYKTLVGKIKVADKTEDICSNIKPYQPCPVNPGPYARSVDAFVPEPSIPGGTYSGTAQAFDQNNKEILCLEFSFKK